MMGKILGHDSNKVSSTKDGGRLLVPIEIPSQNQINFHICSMVPFRCNTKTQIIVTSDRLD